MADLTHYYHQAKGGLGRIDPAEATQLGEDWMVAAGTGVGLGLISVALGGLDKKVFGFSVPLDGIAAGALGLAGLSIKGDAGHMLKLASVAAAGSASVRTFEKFFKAGFKMSGEFEELGEMGISGVHHRFRHHGDFPAFGPATGFGAGAQDALVEAAKYL